MLNLLASDITLLDALVYALFGFAFVFIGIAVLIAILSGIGLIMRKVGKELPAVKQPKKAEPLPAPPVPAKETEVPDEVKAAIVAAIMAFYETEKPYCGFTVKRIKRIG